jgi:DNA topoisomerase VI subunit B
MSGTIAVLEQAKLAATPSPIFTNCGKAETKEALVKPTKPKLTRVPFAVSRLMEFCTRRELVNQTGHDVPQWPLVVVKELLDNAIDACEEADIAPVVSIAINGSTITITDNGPGIPDDTINAVLDYSIRVSSREAYVSPTRGAQGNALKTILPMSYVLDEHRGEGASGKTVIEANGTAHRITFAVDHIKQEPKLLNETAASLLKRGTRITVYLPPTRYCSEETNLVEYNKEAFLRLADAYAWLNPHLSLHITWNGEAATDVAASNPKWQKWLPSLPTSAHWYDVDRFRRYMAAHIAHRGDITVREFVSEFGGMAGTAKQKQVLAETGASHVSLHNFFGVERSNTRNIACLLASLKKYTKPVRPADLGIIGKQHFYSLMEIAGGDPKTFTYNRTLSETNGIPRIVEFAFGIHRDGLGTGRAPGRKFITGVNWSPGISNPFRQLGRAGDSVDSILAEVRANTSQPIIAALHLACPRVAYTDRGKSAIVVEGDVGCDDDES